MSPTIEVTRLWQEDGLLITSGIERCTKHFIDKTTKLSIDKLFMGVQAYSTNPKAVRDAFYKILAQNFFIADDELYTYPHVVLGTSVSETLNGVKFNGIYVFNSLIEHDIDKAVEKVRIGAKVYIMLDKAEEFRKRYF